MMTYMKNEFSECRRKIELISFCWDMLKCEEKFLKNLAYIVTCKFITNFGIPEEKVIQVNNIKLFNNNFSLKIST